MGHARACVEASVADLALELFTQTYLPSGVSEAVLQENGRTVEEQLSSLRFYHSKRGAPTNAAVLLFGKDPLSFFPGAYVQYVKYDGLTQADTPVSERRLAGDLITVMRSLDQLAKGLVNARPVRRADLTEEMIADYPEITLHELFIKCGDPPQLRQVRRHPFPSTIFPIGSKYRIPAALYG